MVRYRLEIHQPGLLNRKYETTYYMKPSDNVFDLIYRSNMEAVKSAIKNGTNVNLKNDKGQTLLHYALLYNQIEIAKFLITQGADQNTEDNKGQKVRDLIEEKCPNIYENISILTALSTPITSEQHLVEDNQVQESGKTNECWCIIL